MYSSVATVLSGILPSRNFIEPSAVEDRAKAGDFADSSNLELLKILREVYTIFKNSIPLNAPSVKLVEKASTHRSTEHTHSIEKANANSTSSQNASIERDPTLTSEHFLKSLPDLSFMLVK